MPIALDETLDHALRQVRHLSPSAISMWKEVVRLDVTLSLHCLAISLPGTANAPGSCGVSEWEKGMCRRQCFYEYRVGLLPCQMCGRRMAWLRWWSSRALWAALRQPGAPPAGRAPAACRYPPAPSVPLLSVPMPSPVLGPQETQAALPVLSPVLLPVLGASATQAALPVLSPVLLPCFGTSATHAALPILSPVLFPVLGLQQHRQHSRCRLNVFPCVVPVRGPQQHKQHSQCSPSVLPCVVPCVGTSATQAALPVFFPVLFPVLGLHQQRQHSQCSSLCCSLVLGLQQHRKRSLCSYLVCSLVLGIQQHTQHSQCTPSVIPCAGDSAARAALLSYSYVINFDPVCFLLA